MRWEDGFLVFHHHHHQEQGSVKRKQFNTVLRTARKRRTRRRVPCQVPMGTLHRNPPDHGVSRNMHLNAAQIWDQRDPVR